MPLGTLPRSSLPPPLSRTPPPHLLTSSWLWLSWCCWGSPARPHLVLPVEGQAGSPAHAPNVGCGHLEDVQLERLLEENDVVLADSEAVVIARGEEGAGSDGAEDLRVLQGAPALLPAPWREASLRSSAGPDCPPRTPQGQCLLQPRLSACPAAEKNLRVRLDSKSGEGLLPG